MTNIAYYRVSTQDQTIDSQRHQLSKAFPVVFDKTFYDQGISGSTLAASREGFRALLEYVREGDCLYVYSLDRLGRDSIDVQQTVKSLLAKGVSLHVNGLGVISSGAGEIIVAVLAQVAELERNRIKERTEAGRQVAKQSLATTGLTHRGKESMGRPRACDPALVKRWRLHNSATIVETALHFGISTSSVTRACK